MVKTYEMYRRSKVGGAWREHGEPVPEAHTWRTVESYVRASWIREVEVTEGEFAAAVTKYCPELAEQVAARAGVPLRAVGKGKKRRFVVAGEPEPTEEPEQPEQPEEQPEAQDEAQPEAQSDAQSDAQDEDAQGAGEG